MKEVIFFGGGEGHDTIILRFLLNFYNCTPNDLEVENTYSTLAWEVCKPGGLRACSPREIFENFRIVIYKVTISELNTTT